MFLIQKLLDTEISNTNYKMILKTNKKISNKVSVIIPVYNNSSTLNITLKSLMLYKKLILEIIIINDASTDNSLDIINKFFKTNSKKTKIILINHKKSHGLAESYNEGIKTSSSDLVVTAHADIILKKNSIEKLIIPFIDENIVATYHQVIHPKKIWLKYNFWQQAFFDRLLYKTFNGLDGKLDCFRKSALIKIGMFDKKTFYRAGEDGDIVYRLKKIGEVVPTKATIIHLHNIDKKFNYKNIIYKQAQYSQTQAVLIRKNGLISLKHFLKTFFREILIICLLIPYLRFVSIILIIIYSIIYTKNTIINNYKNPRIFVLPILNIFLLFISMFYTIKGFVYGKQTI